MPEVKAKLVEGCEPDFKEWSWGLDLDRVIGSAITQVVKSALEEDPPRLQFSFPWYQEDPLQITIELPFGPSVDENAMWSVSLKDVLADLIYGMRRGGKENGLLVYEEGHKNALPIATALRELADWVEAQIEPAPPTAQPAHHPTP